MNILLFSQFEEGFNDEFRRRFAEVTPGCVLDYYDSSWSEEEYHSKLENADIIIGHYNPEDTKYMKNVKFIQMDIEGVDFFIHRPELPADTIMCNAGGAYGNVVAEHAVALVYALCRDLQYYSEFRLAHRWHRIIPDKSVEGSTVLILGAGEIGTAAARLLRPLAAKIIGARRTVREKPEVYDEMITLAEVDSVLPEADIVICALPATALTAGFLSREKLELLPDDAVVVNVGRGSLIPTDDLISVLNEGRIRGVGIDVMEVEPLPEAHPLWNCPRLIITPHAAGNCMSQDSPTNRRIFELTYENVSAFLEGRPLKAVVSRETGYRI